MDEIAIPILRLPHGLDLDLPAYATAHAAGLDLMAAIDQPITMEPGQRAMVPTGVAITIPAGYEGQVRPRSGLAARHGITILNSPGTIDADYRGEITAILINFGQNRFIVEPKARIAQLIVTRVSRVRWQEVESLSESARGTSGFGSTGIGKLAG